MLSHVIATIEALNPDKIVVLVGQGCDDVIAAAQPYETVVQVERLGTGHAVQTALCALNDFMAEDADIMIAFGDTPLVKEDTYRTMLATRQQGEVPAVVTLSFRSEVPTRYGRVNLDASGQVIGIIEYAEASQEQRQNNLCNGGIMLVDGSRLQQLLVGLSNENTQGEYYLTDIVAASYEKGWGTVAVETSEEEVMGVNSRLDQSRAEAALQCRLRVAAMAQGVTLIDPATTWLSVDTAFGRDVVIEPSVFIGKGVSIASGARIRAYSHLEGATVGPATIVGPYARLRPEVTLGEEVKIGNFVEIKKATLEKGVKVNHLSYIGDARVGAEANIGAGTITCNYDGFSKYETVIGESAFVGSNTALVAPVTIGKGAIVGAGSTVTKSVPDDALSLVRGQRKEKEQGAVRFRSLRQRKRE